MTWRPKDWENPFPVIAPIPENLSVESAYIKHLLFEAGADAMHKADIEWLIQRIAYNGKNYAFNMNSKEWQEFIK